MDKSYTLTQDQKVDLVNFCKNYPSGDNCQPFKFIFTQGNLILSHDPERGAHNLNPYSVASIISLGALEYYLEVWLDNNKLSVSKKYTFTNIQQGVFEARYSFFQVSSPKSKTLPSVDKRECNRQKYKKSKQLFDLTDVFSNLDTRFPNIGRYHLETPLQRNLMDYIKDAESYMWKDNRSIDDFFRWLKFKSPCPEGLYWKNLGINIFVATTLFLMKKINFLRNIFKYSIQVQSQSIVNNLINSSDGVIILSTKDDKPESLVDIGFNLTYIWCSLNINRKSLQPHNLGFIPLYAAKSLKHKTNKKYDTLLNSGHQILSKELSFTTDEIAAWMFRYGNSARLNEDSKVGRLPNQNLVNSID